MGKSIRSKIKRMHRAEFRRTIGTEAYEKQMEKVTTILHDTIEKQTFQSMNKLMDAFDTTTTSTAMETDSTINNEPQQLSTVSRKVTKKINENIGIYENEPIDVSSGTTTTSSGGGGGGGENKVIVSKKSKRKQKHGYRMKAIITTASTSRSNTTARVKTRPKFYCSF